jgi:O-antigen/teichoic acid export membrane protein
MPDKSTGRIQGSVRRRMVVGFGWTVAARWSIRGIGVLSTIVLARLLTPADFGLVAMAMLTVAFVRVFAEAGQHLAIIRHPDPTPEHFDTAWTMSVLGGFLVALVLVAIAPVAGWYFHEPRAVPLFRFLALAPFIAGFTNVGVVAGFLRDLSFDKDFRFLVVQRFGTFAVTVPAALILRDYWALAIGIVLGRLASVLASYRMHPYRPRLRLAKLGELWSFSAWTQLDAIAQYFCDQIDQIAVGGLAGAGPMGTYNVGRDLATSPTNEVVIPAARSLFPIYATLLGDPARLAQSYSEVLSFVAIIALATGVGMAVVAKDLVVVVLGSKWSSAAGLVPWLAIGAGVLGVTRSVNAVISVTGHPRLSTARNAIFVALLAPATILCGLRWGGEGVAAARMAVTILFAPVMFYSVMQVIPVTAGEIIARLWRPALAALSMAAIVSLSGAQAISLVVPRLLCNVALGSAVFPVVLLSLWFLAGRPAGAELVLVGQARAAVRRSAAAIGRLRGARRVAAVAYSFGASTEDPIE